MTTPPAPNADGMPWAAAAMQGLLSHKAMAMAAAAWAPANEPDAILLTSGEPDPECYPFDQLNEATAKVLYEQGSEALTYGGTYGYTELRRLIADRADHQPGLGYTADNVTLVSGSAQGLANIFDTFIDPGDTVVVEMPAWGGIIRTLKGYGANIEGVPIDDEGICAQELDDTISRLIREGNKPKFVYTIPTFQNPMGLTMSLERRRQVVDICSRHQVLICEDDPYGELRFHGTPVPSILSVAGGDGVLRNSTFSKTIGPGLRVGWITGERGYIEKLQGVRFDSGTSPFTTRLIAAYIEAGHYEPHIKRMSALYNEKCDMMLAALEESCSKYMTWTKPEGGFFIWCTLNEGMDIEEVTAAAKKEQVQFFPGMGFFPNGDGRRNMRLCFSTISKDLIQEAITRLGRALAASA